MRKRGAGARCVLYMGNYSIQLGISRTSGIQAGLVTHSPPAAQKAQFGCKSWHAAAAGACASGTAGVVTVTPSSGSSTVGALNQMFSVKAETHLALFVLRS